MEHNRQEFNEQENTLQGNETIEEAIVLLQMEPSQERLAHALTVMRRRMKEQAHLIPSVEAAADGNMRLKTLRTEDGKLWFTAFTGFDEQMKGNEPVMSAFTTPIGKLFLLALKTDQVEGVIINPWNKTLMMDKELIRITIGAKE